jgi:hypothetical protein
MSGFFRNLTYDPGIGIIPKIRFASPNHESDKVELAGQSHECWHRKPME